MTEKPSTYGHQNNVVDFKNRNGERQAHSQYGQFVPDEELLQSTSRIKQKRDELRERLSKMQEANARVSRTVYEKVRRDYLLQLETVEGLLIEKKQKLKDEIKKLFVAREKLSFEINRHKEILEEAEFRHFLGDFSRQNFEEVEQFETNEIEKLELDLSHIQQWIRVHEELFDSEDFGDRPQKIAEPTKVTAPESTRAETVTQATAPAKIEAPVAVQKPVIEARVEVSEKLPPEDDFAHLFRETVASRDADVGMYTNTEHNIKAILDGPSEEKTPELAVGRAAAQAMQQDTSAAEDLEEPAPSIEDLLEETYKLPDDEEISEASLPAPEADYFKNAEVKETTFHTVPKISAEEASVSVKETVSEAAAKIVSDVTTLPGKEKLAEGESQPVQKDDSISLILNSIKLDDEAEAPAKVASEAGKGPRLVLTQGDLDANEFPLKDNTSIGRSPSNDISLKEPKVSRQHAAINKYNQNYILIDLKSSNGVFVNGAKIDETTLNPGDEISIGGYKFIFHAE